MESEQESTPVSTPLEIQRKARELARAIVRERLDNKKRLQHVVLHPRQLQLEALLRQELIADEHRRRKMTMVVSSSYGENI